MNDFLLANYVIETRSYNMRGKKYLMPGGDFVNHHDPQDMASLLDKSTQSQGAQFLRTHRLVNDQLHVSVSSPFSPEEQITESYGDNPNTVYFTYHGFIQPKNLHDCHQVPSPLDDQIVSTLSTQHHLAIKLTGNFDRRHVCINDHPITIQKLILLLTLLQTQDTQAIQNCLRKLPADDLHRQYYNIHVLTHCLPPQHIPSA